MRQAILKQCSSNAINSKQLTDTVTSSKRLTAEESPLSGSPPWQGSSEEQKFLGDLARTLADWDARQSSLELANWGGWWRNRFREDATKAWRILAEVRSMITEQRIRKNAGACAKDLWERFK